MEQDLKKKIEDRKDVLEKVKTVLIERLNLYQKPEEIDEDTPLFGSGLRLDSVDATEVIVMLDMAFKIKVKEGTDPSFMRNINRLVDFILEQKAEAALVGADSSAN